MLKRIASRKMPLTEAEKWLDHLGSCSPCYRDFSQFRKAYELRGKRTLLAVAASILIAAGIAGWILVHRHNEILVAKTAVLDLTNRSLARGVEPNPDEPPMVIRRNATHWEIDLPLGSGDGPYDVRLLSPSGESVLSTSGIAIVADKTTLLQVEVSLSASRPGQYILQVRKAGSEWNSYSVLLS